MNITSQAQQSPKGDRQYPWIGIHKSQGTVILFYDRNCGVVLTKGAVAAHWRTGYQSENFSMNEFDQFRGTIVITCED